MKVENTMSKHLESLYQNLLNGKLPHNLTWSEAVELVEHLVRSNHMARMTLYSASVASAPFSSDRIPMILAWRKFLDCVSY